MRAADRPSVVARRRRFFRLRVAILLGVLVIVLAYAAYRTLRDRARTDWQRPLRVAFVVVPIGAIDAGSVHLLRARSSELEAALTREMHRYRTSPDRPFEVTILGPTPMHEAPPEPEGDGVFDLIGYEWRRWRWTRSIDGQLAIDPGLYDTRVYLAVRRTAGKTEMVEGASEQGGHVGVVTCDLDASTIDWTLSVAAHEAMHTVGATDKYDDDGHARVPEGLADAQKDPLYPQLAAEIMSHGVALSPTSERPLATLSELRVGELTAQEIGWLRR